MTREEAIEYNKNLRMYMKLSDKNEPYKFLEENYIALDMAIKALEQEPILDKIRAEIEGLTYYWCEVNPKSVIDDALQIIDKYREEQEDADND